MKITRIRVNHLIEPLGFDLSNLQIDFAVSGKWQESCQKKIAIYTVADGRLLYHESKPYTDNIFHPQLALKPRTRYKAIVSLEAPNETVQKSTYFETGKMGENYLGRWIGHPDKDLQNTLFIKKFQVSKKIKQARLYATGLGVYVAYMNQQRIGKEILAPGLTAYDKWVQVQTYDVSMLLQPGQNELLLSVGDGWYKGNFLFSGGKDNIYGDQQRILAELHLEYQDGSQEVIKTDGSWLTSQGQVTKSAIYYGEDFDGSREINDWQPAQVLNFPIDILTDRYSLPMTVQEELSVKKVIKTPKDEVVLDFGQNQAGVLKFYNDLPKGQEVIFSFGEILQDGCFYRGNLRQARAEWHFKSNGLARWVTPNFTYFGYRYVKVSGIKQVESSHFVAQVIHSQMLQTGNFTSNNSEVNRLFENVLWGQKSNFFDIPTDCPQRDERLGWTGDAEILVLYKNVCKLIKRLRVSSEIIPLISRRNIHHLDIHNPCASQF